MHFFFSLWVSWIFCGFAIFLLFCFFPFPIPSFQFQPPFSESFRPPPFACPCPCPSYSHPPLLSPRSAHICSYRPRHLHLLRGLINREKREYEEMVAHEEFRYRGDGKGDGVRGVKPPIRKEWTGSTSARARRGRYWKSFVL